MMKLVAGTCLLLLTSAVSASSSSKPKQLRRTRNQSHEALERSVEAVDPALAIHHVPHVVRESRIVGGRPASAGSYPYFVQWDGCGASLIHNDIILTAAHCNEVTDNGVIVGATRAGSTFGQAEARQIVARRPHPSYDEFTIANDFMVMKLNQPSTLPPVAINGLRSSPADNEVLTVIGFGTTSEGAMFGSFVLREVNVSAVPDAVCNQQYGGDVEDEIMFCGGVTGGGKDSCQGDSGGPIMNSNGVQVGVVSWGQGCGDEDYSGVYSRISGAKDWVNEQICELSSNPPDFCNNSGNNDGGYNGSNGDNGGNDSAPPAGTIPVVVDITFDDYPEESGLKLTVQSTGQVITNLPAGSFVGDYTEIFDLPMGQNIDVELSDVFGDGLCCDYGQGGIRVAALLSDDEEEELATEDGRFTSSKIFSFFVPISQQDQGDGGAVDPINGDAGTVPPPPAQGCQDLTGGNFTVDSLVGDQDCAWLGVNLGRYHYLCQFLDVAATCRATCEACHYFT